MKGDKMRGTVKGRIYTKYEDENQKLSMGNGSWSINLEELPPDTELIEYITEDITYVIRRKIAFKHGFVKILGGEKKLVVPLKWWQKGTVALDDV